MTSPIAPESYPASSGLTRQSGEHSERPSTLQDGGGSDSIAKKPSGGTAIAAAILGIPGVLFAANFIVVHVLNPLYDYSFWVQCIGLAAEVLTLGPGLILLLWRKTAGRWLVVAGCVLNIAVDVTNLVNLIARNAFLLPGKSGFEAVDIAVLALFIMFVPPVATTILTMLPATGRWLAWRDRTPVIG
ncbi:MAG TPA: hypothetical protein VFG87_22080 [Amycolatopsis sp.]|nr:hypothetical protein [Amycolatopsis sp.]